MREDIENRLAGLVTRRARIATRRRGNIAPTHMTRNYAHYLRRPVGLRLRGDLASPLCANFPRPVGGAFAFALGLGGWAGFAVLAKRFALAWFPRFGLLMRCP